MKNLILAIFIALSGISYSQLTFRVSQWSKDGVVIERVNDIYIVNVADEYMTHIVMDANGNVTASQCYYINLHEYIEEENMLTFTCVSSLTGTVYSYAIIEGSGSLRIGRAYNLNGIKYTSGTKTSNYSELTSYN
jgi:hypothetical protein